MPAQDDRAPKRMRLAELDPALSPDLHSAAPSLLHPNFHIPADASSGFNQQYHWPAEPASATSSSNISGIVIPPLANTVDPPLPMPMGAMRFSDETLHSAVAAGAARAMATAASGSTGTAKLSPQVGMSTRSNGAAGGPAYAEAEGGEAEGERSRRPSESDIHSHIHIQHPDDDGDDGDHDHSQDGNPNRQTPFSRTPELKVHHKLAERQRRKEMKDLFDELRELLPTERGTKSSKWEILKRAIEYIGALRHSQSDYIAEIERLRRDVEMLGGTAAAAYGMGSGSGPHPNEVTGPHSIPIHEAHGEEGPM